MQTAYTGSVALVQVRDVPEATVERLKERAAAEGLSLATYLRNELQRLADRPSNAEVIARILARPRSGGPTREEIVAEIRKVRDSS
jgi:hypothetical protein